MQVGFGYAYFEWVYLHGFLTIVHEHPVYKVWVHDILITLTYFSSAFQLYTSCVSLKFLCRFVFCVTPKLASLCIPFCHREGLLKVDICVHLLAYTCVTTLLFQLHMNILLTPQQMRELMKKIFLIIIFNWYKFWCAL